MTDSISNSDDLIDSRDVISRIEELTEARDDYVTEWLRATVVTLGGEDEDEPEPEDYSPEFIEAGQMKWAAENEDDAAELVALKAFAKEAEDYAADWLHGEAMIRNSYFAEYAEQLAEDIGAIDRNAKWPLNHIDWEAAASELKHDYTEVDFDGVSYWVR